MKKLKIIASIIGIWIIGGLLIISLFYNGYLRFNYPSKNEYPIQWIDVSHHQNDIDWKKVKQAGITFAFIKATEWDNFKDNRFLENWKEAKENGVDVGAYHFFNFCVDGKLQAKNYIKSVPKEANILPPVIDLEYDGSCGNGEDKTAKQIVEDIKIIEQKFHKYYGKKPIFYVTKEFYEAFLIGKFPENPLWYRSIFHSPRIKDKRKWTFWQFANRWHLDWISGFVDLNVFYGTKQECQQFKH